jgi:hypothetical protein
MPLAIDFQTGLSNAWANVVAFVPKLVAALAVLLIGYLVAKAVARILNKILERVGFDRAVERGGVKRALARSRYDASSTSATSATTTRPMGCLPASSSCCSGCS